MNPGYALTDEEIIENKRKAWVGWRTSHSRGLFPKNWKEPILDEKAGVRCVNQYQANDNRDSTDGSL
jgi:hypothetical protein